MGDVIGLIEKAQQAYDEDTAREQAEKMMSGSFTLEDFANQLRQVRKMGPLAQILGDAARPDGPGGQIDRSESRGEAAPADRGDHKLDDPQRAA